MTTSIQSRNPEINQSPSYFRNYTKQQEEQEPKIFMRKIGTFREEREDRATEKMMSSERDQMMQDLKRENEKLKMIVQESREVQNNLEHQKTLQKGFYLDFLKKKRGKIMRGLKW